MAKQISPPDFKPDFLYQYLLKFQFQYHFWIPQGILRSKLPKILNFDELLKELWAENQRKPKFKNTKSLDATFHGMPVHALLKNDKNQKIAQKWIFFLSIWMLQKLSYLIFILWEGVIKDSDIFFFSILSETFLPWKVPSIDLVFLNFGFLWFFAHNSFNISSKFNILGSFECRIP